MKYMGSKAKHADEILAVVLAKRQPGQCYVEPFVGGANVLCRVPQAGGPRIAADVNKYMIALHRALATGWHPPETMTEAQFNDIRDHNDRHPPELVAFAATGCTFGSIWFNTFVTETGKNGGIAMMPDKAMKAGLYTACCAQAARSCLRDAPGLAGVEFHVCSYDSLKIPPKSLVYCDPPYVGTEGYMGSAQSIKVGESLDKNTWRAYKFWRWADALVDAGHTVFVSEYTGPTADAFPPVIAPEVQDEIKRLAAEAQAKQRDMNCPNDVVQAAVNAWIAAKDAAQRNAKSRKDDWKIVWEKEVSVTIDAVGMDVDARDALQEELNEIEAEMELHIIDDIKNKTARAAELRRQIDATFSTRVERLFHRPTPGGG